MHDPLSAAAHVIQLALTPIFLLTAVASLLNVFSTRLGRVSDRVHALKKEPRVNQRALARLRRRSRILDVAVTLAAAAGAMTCCSAITLFFGVLRDSGHAAFLFVFFGGGLLFAVMGLACFVAEITLAGRTLRDEDDDTGADR
ncbi:MULTISPECIES: DUF2721 domain-containing protein [unclassified Sphingomonas]|jgi:Protein of unknown function (DUF2721)|uniref:DUF2721 domain-containing protein n=1 Tax=unclassified Sphingomonas TaxID=196159 RepID=UPI0018E585F2|nr:MULTISPECIES: DUF2721 domain-containing protein [unclassified Sphingomonas]